MTEAPPTTLDSPDWPAAAWPAAASAPRRQGFAVVIRRSVLNAVAKHAASASSVEVCGVLVGNVYRDGSGPFLRIDAAIRGDFAGSAAAQVTFTAETWTHIQAVMDRDYPDRRIVGWYHSHPGFGIFLSDMDLFIHGNFFNLPWQVAFVHDPASREDGMFLWRDGKAERSPYAVEEDVEKELPVVPVSPEITAAALADFSRRMQRMEGRLKTLVVAVPIAALVALVWPFVLFTIMSDRASQAPSPAPSPSAMPEPPTRVSSLPFDPPAQPATQPLVIVPATTRSIDADPHPATAQVIRPATIPTGPRVLRQPATTSATQAP
jgi:proteasome lid subunit RPN8/RPN11